VAVGRVMIAGLASASTTSRPAGPRRHSTSAVCGKCCSSCCSTTNSRDRCAVPASEELAPTARDVLSPHDVLSLIPAVRDRESDSAAELLASRLADPLPSANGANVTGRVRPRPRLRPAVSVADRESATESDVPTVLVYESPAVSVTEAPTVSVNWLATSESRSSEHHAGQMRASVRQARRAPSPTCRALMPASLGHRTLCEAHPANRVAAVLRIQTRKPDG
jgi:hypothetical protein